MHSSAKQKRRGRWPYILAAVFGLIVLDFVMASAANRIVLARDADFERVSKSVSLDFKGPVIQECRWGKVLYLYNYYTCFVGYRPDLRKKEIEYFDYTYQRPIPLFIGLFYWYGSNAVHKEFIGTKYLEGKVVHHPNYGS